MFRGGRGAADRVKTEKAKTQGVKMSGARRPISIVRATCVECTRVRDDCRLSAVGGREAVSENPVDNDRSRYDDGRYPRTIIM